MAPVFSGEWRLRRHSRRAVNHPVRSVDDPLAVLMLDALDVPETREGRRSLRQTGRQSGSRPAPGRRAPRARSNPEHFFRTTSVHSPPYGARDGAGGLRRGGGCGRHFGFFSSRSNSRRCGRALPHVRLRSLQMIETLAELGQLGTRPARRRIKIGFQRRDLG